METEYLSAEYTQCGTVLKVWQFASCATSRAWSESLGGVDRAL